MSISQTLIINVEHPLRVDNELLISRVAAYLAANPVIRPYTVLTITDDLTLLRQDGVEGELPGQVHVL